MKSKTIDGPADSPVLAASSMKIYFCDICNESIPLKDINSNSITIERGKIFCQKCAPANVKSRTYPPGFFAAVAGAFVAIAGLTLWGFDLRSRLADAEGRLGTAVRRLEAYERTSGEALAELRGQAGGLRDQQQRLRDDLASSRAELQSRHETLDLREAQNVRDLRDQARKSHDELKSRLDSSEQKQSGALLDLKLQYEGTRAQVAGLRDRLALLEALLTAAPVPAAPEAETGIAAGPPIAPEREGDAPAAPSPEDLKARASFIAEVAHADPGRRYSAVLALRDHSGPEVVDALASRAGDPEEHIRIAVIESLRLQKSPRAIPSLIACLRDREYLVRLYASRALRDVSGHQIPFNPDGQPLERERQAKAWEAWWKENRSRIAGEPEDG